MNEHLTKAEQTCNLLHGDLRAAHREAINSGAEFAQLVILDLLQQCAELHIKVRAAHDAASSLRERIVRRIAGIDR